MNRDDFLVVASKSRYDLMMQRLDGDHEAAMEELVFDEVRKDVCDGHDAQKKNLEYLISLFGQENVLTERSDLTEELAKKYKFIISAGGDEHYCWVAHNNYDVPLLGYVLDERRSAGAMLYYERKGFEDDIEKICKGEYKIEEWTKVGAAINGQKIEPAISFYLFKERDDNDNSRMILEFNGEKYYQRVSSGLLVTTGAGSTGWYKNIHRDAFGDKGSYGRQEKMITAILRETGNTENRKFCIREGDVLKIRSYFDSEGIARPDSLKENTYDFKMGSVAEVKVADETLKVVKT